MPQPGDGHAVHGSTSRRGDEARQGRNRLEMLPRRTVIAEANLVGELDRREELQRGKRVEPQPGLRREERLGVSDVLGFDVLQPKRGDDEVLELVPQCTERIPGASFSIGRGRRTVRSS